MFIKQKAECQMMIWVNRFPIAGLILVIISLIAIIPAAICELELSTGDKIYTSSTNNLDKDINQSWVIYNFTVNYNKNGEPLIVKINNLENGTLDFNWRMDKQRESRRIDLYKNGLYLASCMSDRWLSSSLNYKINSSDVLQIFMRCDSLKGGWVQIAFPPRQNILTSGGYIVHNNSINGSNGSIKPSEINGSSNSTENDLFYVDLNVSDPEKHIYPSIQQAVSNVSNNGTIIVESNFYNEDVVITKPLRLIGTDIEKTIIDGNENSINIKANNVTIKNFTIINGQNGIYASDAKSILITNNKIQNCSSNGMIFKNCRSITIDGNTVTQSGDFGIYAANGELFDIRNNKIILSRSNGIGLYNCTYIRAYDNLINNSYVTGLNLLNTHKCNLTNNSMNQNNDTSVYLYGSNNNFILSNYIYDTYYGIELCSGSDKNEVFSNNMSKIGECDLELFKEGPDNKYQSNIRLCKSR